METSHFSFLALLLVAVLFLSQSNATEAGAEAERNIFFHHSKKKAQKVMGYFTSWCGYSHHYTVEDIPAEDLTHVFYAFANIENGKCVVGDKFADMDKSYPGDTWDQPVRGNFNQLNNVIKSQHPHLKTLISVGGWSWSKHFSDIAADEEKRQVFAKSCVNFMKRYGFDGIDVDWEYPVSGGMANNGYRPDDGANYALLLKDFRKELQNTGKDYLLTIAAPASQDKYKHMPLKAMSKHVDWFNVMTYDYNACTYGNLTSHHTALYRNSADPSKADQAFNTDSTIKGYMKEGVPKDMIAMGAAFYGKGYEGLTKSNNEGSKEPWMFTKYDRCPQGTWDDWKSGKTGTFDYVDIEKKLANLEKGQNWVRYWDDKAKAPYIVREDEFSNDKNVLISYDDEKSLKAKAKYANSKGLAGMFAWSLDGDISNTLVRSLRQANKDEVKEQRKLNLKMALHTLVQGMGSHPIVGARTNSKAKTDKADAKKTNAVKSFENIHAPVGTPAHKEMSEAEKSLHKQVEDLDKIIAAQKLKINLARANQTGNGTKADAQHSVDLAKVAQTNEDFAKSADEMLAKAKADLKAQEKIQEQLNLDAVTKILREKSAREAGTLHTDTDVNDDASSNSTMNANATLNANAIQSANSTQTSNATTLVAPRPLVYVHAPGAPKAIIQPSEAPKVVAKPESGFKKIEKSIVNFFHF